MNNIHRHYEPALNDSGEKNINERRLWAATIKLAMDDIKYGHPKRKKRNQAHIRHYNSAVAWLNRIDDYSVGSFLYVCEILKFNPTLIRKHILSAV